MDQLSRIPRVGGIALLGLALGLLWAALVFLVQSAPAYAADDEPAVDGLLGVVTQSVPSLTGVTEDAASAVQSTTSAIAETVEELPVLGHLSTDDVVEPVVAIVDPVVESVESVESMVEPVVEPVIEPVVAPVVTTVDAVIAPVIGVLDSVGSEVLDTLPGLDDPVTDVRELLEPVTMDQADDVALVEVVATSQSLAGMQAVPHLAETPVATAISAPTADDRIAHPAGESTVALATVGAVGGAAAPAAHLDALAGQGTAVSSGAAAPADDQAPPGPTYGTDTTPD